MIIRLSEPKVKILVNRDPIKTFFKEWARPIHLSRTIAKGLDTTTWIWNLHVDAHDFDSHTSDLKEIKMVISLRQLLVMLILTMFGDLDRKRSLMGYVFT